MSDRNMTRRRLIRAGGLAATGLGAVALAGCGEVQVVTETKIQEVIREVPVERIVTKEVIKEVAVEKEVIVEVEKVVTKIVEKVKIVEKLVTAAMEKPQLATGEVVHWDFWGRGYSELEGRWQDFLKEDFEAKNPGLKLKYVEVPFGGEFVQKVVAAHAAGSSADAVRSSVVWGRDFWDLGILQPLNPLIATDPEMSMDHYMPGALTYNQKEGEIYGIPVEGPDSYTLNYDKTLFLEAGIDPSFEAVWNWTWDDWRENAKKLTKRDAAGEIEQAGYLVSVPHGGRLGALLTSADSGYYNDDQSALQLTDGKAKAVVELLLGFLEDGSSLPLSADRQDFVMFCQGKAAMVNGGTWDIGEVADCAPDKNWDFVPFPEGPGGSGPGTATWYNMVVMPEKAKNPEGAWAWMQYFGGLPTFKNLISRVNRFAPRKALYVSDEWFAALDLEPLLQRTLQLARVGGVYPFIRYNSVQNVLKPKLESIFVEGADIDKTLAEVEELGNPYLEEAGG